MAVFEVNYPYHPKKVKSLFFRFLNPAKRLSSLTVCEGTSYKDRNVYPVATEAEKAVTERYLVFTAYDYCYYTGKNRGIIVQKNGDWYQGKFSLRKYPISGTLCKDGKLTFYLFHIPVYSTGVKFRYLLIFTMIFAIVFFGRSHLNFISEKNIFTDLIKKKENKKSEYKKNKIEIIKIDYSKLDPGDEIAQWRPKKELTGILGKMMQEGVDSYVLAKKKYQKRDYRGAYTLYADASTNGFVPAYYHMGVHFLNGSPDRKLAANGDYAKMNFRFAAVEDHIPSQYQLARCYFYGIGTQKSIKLAKYWGYKAAITGYLPAQRMLGIILMEENVKIGFQWLLCAAYQGDHEAQYQLGKCYQNGIGVMKNPQKAAGWYRLSSENRKKNAKKC